MKALAIVLALLASGRAFAQETPPANQPQAQEAAAAEATAADAPAAEQAPEAKPAASPDSDDDVHVPPGFQKVKRGKHVVWCKHDVRLGTRFKTVTCYDKKQLKEYIRIQQENQTDVNQRRAICTTQGVCAPQ